MASSAHQSDVAELAAALLGVGTPEGSLAYRPGNRFFDLLESDEEFDEITIDISGQTSNLRETLAALDAVQLAIDAAAAAVEYRIQYVDDDDEDTVRGRLRELRPEPTWELQVIELSSPGSFKAKLKAFVSSPTARKKAMAVGGLAASVATTFFAPVAGIPGIVVSVIGVADAFLPPKPPKEAFTERLTSKQAEEREATGADLPEWDQAVRASFEAGFDKLTEYLRQQQLESLAREDALRAEVQELKLVVEKLQRNSGSSN
jgi:hypothetical protein